MQINQQMPCGGKRRADAHGVNRRENYARHGHFMRPLVWYFYAAVWRNAPERLFLRLLNTSSP